MVRGQLPGGGSLTAGQAVVKGIFDATGVRMYSFRISKLLLI